MRLPVAATDARPEGFSWTTDGEPVYAALLCNDDDARDALLCGCGRSFVGIYSQKTTTQAVVTEMSIGLAELRKAVARSLARDGWISDGEPLEPAAARLVAEVCAEMVEIGDVAPEGARLCRVLDDVFVVDE